MIVSHFHGVWDTDGMTGIQMVCQGYRWYVMYHGFVCREL